MAPTDLLTKYATAGKTAAVDKYANDLGSLAKYMFTAPPPGVTAPHGDMAEMVRFGVFGDPVNAYHEVRTGGAGKFLRNSFWHPAYGKGNALGYAIPAALTAMTYANMDPGTRMQHKGELLGSAVGGLAAGAIGQRFGLLGMGTVGVGGERLGRWAGQKLDNRLNGPKPTESYYGVNNPGHAYSGPMHIK